MIKDFFIKLVNSINALFAMIYLFLRKHAKVIGVFIAIISFILSFSAGGFSRDNKFVIITVQNSYPVSGYHLEFEGAPFYPDKKGRIELPKSVLRQLATIVETSTGKRLKPDVMIQSMGQEVVVP